MHREKHFLSKTPLPLVLLFLLNMFLVFALQLLFVFNVCIFGALAGAGILAAQYYGSGDNKGLSNILRSKLYIAFFTLAAFMAVLVFFGEELTVVHLYRAGDEPENIRFKLKLMIRTGSGKHLLKDPYPVFEIRQIT